MSLSPTFSLTYEFHYEESCKRIGYHTRFWYGNGLLGEGRHARLSRVGDTLIHGLMNGEQSFGGLNDNFLGGALVVSNRLMQVFSKDTAPRD
jgi:hypothetical protein